MKKFLPVAILLLSTVSYSQVSTTFPGNGKNSFGGAVGQGSLKITDKGDSVSFALTRGPGLFDSVIVFYLDAEAGGISSTSGFTTKKNDPYYTAVTGLDSATGNRAVLNFPADFQPDGAIAFDKNGGKFFLFIQVPFLGTFIQELGTFKVIPSGTNSAPTYTQSTAKSDLGTSGPLNFKFVGSYIGARAFRSNEAFGDPFDNYLTTTLSYAPYTIKSYFTFSSASVLPVKLVDFKAAKERDNVSINWLVAEESNIEAYEVQRSANGINFTTIEKVKAKNSSAATSYSVKDLLAKGGINYYRLLIVGKDKSEISKIVSLNINAGKNSFVANYKSGKILNVRLNGISAGTYRISVISSNGQLVQTIGLQHDGTGQNKQLVLKADLAKGIYRVALQSETENYIGSIMVE